MSSLGNGTVKEVGAEEHVEEKKLLVKGILLRVLFSVSVSVPVPVPVPVFVSVFVCVFVCKCEDIIVEVACGSAPSKRLSLESTSIAYSKDGRVCGSSAHSSCNRCFN